MLWATEWGYAPLLVVLSLFLSAFFALFLYYFSEDWKRGRVDRVDVAGLVQGLVGLFTFHVVCFFAMMFKAAGEAFGPDVAAFWYFAMYPVLFYVYSAVRLVLGRSCPAPLAAAAVAYGVSTAVEHLALLPTAALAIPAAMACKKDGGKRAGGVSGTPASVKYIYKCNYATFSYGGESATAAVYLLSAGAVSRSDASEAASDMPCL